MTDVTVGRLTIGEVAARSGVAASALRFYEERGLISSQRADSNQRRYAPDVLRRVAFIRIAQRVGLSLEEIGAALSTLPDARTPNKRDWERLAQLWKPRIQDQISVLTRLHDQLGACIGCGCLSLRTCALNNPHDAAAKLGTGPRYLLGDNPSDV
ncbi:MAG: redox-sensitive transcriptional activator SoxR [Actinomycetota bacterium]|nr:redox-sensitive transcriptional activator SoxR [Actinomycetota bacterium]